jgi:hypothetical protein
MATKTTKNTKTSVEQEKNMEGSEGLAAIARLILREGFRTTGFQAIYKTVLEVSNKLAKGESLPVNEVEETVVKIESHIENIEENYDPEVQDIMRNYFIRLAQRVREWNVKNKTPNSLEELRETA